MNIEQTKNGNALTIVPEGYLDTATAPEFRAVLETALEDVKELTFDFGKLEYISSSGLRQLLFAQKVMNGQGTMKVIHANDTIREIFEVTGFSDVLTIE
jgi:anti-sigma B factor antagonist